MVLNESREYKVVFEEDEMRLCSFSKSWDRETLLDQEGIFFLKDIARVLEIDAIRVKKRALGMAREGLSPWKTMGARKVFNHWIIRMKVFAPYFRSSLISKLRKVRKGWNGNTLLNQKGIFLLTDVCTLIPFTSHQLRYQARQNPRARQELGIWKDRELNTFVVDMERFAPWINELWAGTLDDL